MIEHGDAFGVSTGTGRLIASGLTVMYDGPFGWISMILVTQEYRRRGLATRLMRACMDALRGHGLVPALDASPEGREVYLRLGFSDVYRTTRMYAPGGRAAVAGETAVAPETRGMDAEDLPGVVAWDLAPYGADRSYMLEHLHGRLPDAAFVAERDGRIRGMVLAPTAGPAPRWDRSSPTTPGPRWRFCGVHSTRSRTGLSRHRGPPRAHPHLARFTRILTRRTFVRMIHERGEPYDDPKRVFVIAGPELG